MLVLDIDLDAFVLPIVLNRHDADERPGDAAHEVWSIEEVRHFVLEQCKVVPGTDGAQFEHHVDVVAKTADLIEQGKLVTPLTWIHVDAHDDLTGHFNQPVTSANFLYECIRREWLDRLVFVHPLDGWQGLPFYVLNQAQDRIEFEDVSVPIELSPLHNFTTDIVPDFVFLTRSPAFSPPKADAVFDNLLELLKME